MKRHPSLRGRVEPKGHAVAAVNFRCIEGLDLDKVHRFDGRFL